MSAAPREAGPRHRVAIVFLVLAACVAGVYAAWSMPSSVFPTTDFPRVVILIDMGVVPADEMTATITRPVEEVMKNIPGAKSIRSSTGRGSAAVNVFFDWGTDMRQAELYVQARLAQIRARLPREAEFVIHRLNFSAFPILGISLTSAGRSPTELWELARYELQPRLLRAPGVARVQLVGGRVPEYHVILDPSRLQARGLSLEDVDRALSTGNSLTAAGMHEEDHQLYLVVLDARARTPAELEALPVGWEGPAPIRISDVGCVRRGARPQFNRVTAEGGEAVLLNVYSQEGASTLEIARAVQGELEAARRELPGGVEVGLFYDQSTFLREGIGSVWESIGMGLLLSVLVLYAFLRSASATFLAASVIPITVLLTLVGMRALGMSFNLMTLGGIAAAIGLVIDDAIVVVEAIYAKLQAGAAVPQAIGDALREIGWPLVGSTLTPVVVFLPLAFLDGVPGVFFRALAVTMVTALLTSLLLAVTWTPALGSFTLASRGGEGGPDLEAVGPVLRRLIGLYEGVLRLSLRGAPWALLTLACVVALGAQLYARVDVGFLPEQDEGAFVLDYYTRPGTSLTETNRALERVEAILRAHSAVESFSRRTGARLALGIAEPNTGDFLVKLRAERDEATEAVIATLRGQINAAEPALHTEFPGVLGDLIGDLTWSPRPVEIKLFSTDTALLKEKAAEIAARIEALPGVVDVEDGLVVAGPTLKLGLDRDAAARSGLSPAALGRELEAGNLGRTSSYVLEGDRVLDVRLRLERSALGTLGDIVALPLQSPAGESLTLGDLVQVEHSAGELEIQREDQRLLVAVSAALEGVDLRRGVEAIQASLSDLELPPSASLEYGGTFREQQRSFQHLFLVLGLALCLVFGVLVVEFRALLQPIAIVSGSALAVFGSLAALLLSGTSLNIMSLLGGIIGVGIVAKNGILLLDLVEQLRGEGLSLEEALVASGRRRLRPVVMTSVTTLLGLLPLAAGVGAGADMLRPLAISVMGALVMSLLLSLVATPLIYAVLVQSCARLARGRAATLVAEERA